MRKLAHSVVTALGAMVREREVTAVRVIGKMSLLSNEENEQVASCSPLAVTLSTSALVQSTIVAKIKMRKLYSTQLGSDLLQEVNTVSLVPLEYQHQ